MKVDFKIVLVALAAVAVGAFVSWYMMRGERQTVEPKKSVARRVAVSRRNAKVKKVTEISLERRNGKNAVRIVESERAIPRLGEGKGDDVGEESEEKLTELQQSVIKELQEALDANDLKAVRRALSKFSASASRGGLGGRVPKSMRLSAVQALGWFGKDAAVDIIEFMADGDEEVSSEACDQFELALQDCAMGDFERAEILKSAMHAVTDSDRIDSLLCALNEMRNSCKCETIKDILKNGTEPAKAMMLEQLEFYTESDVTPDTLDRWAAMNPDGEDDAEFYGGVKE